LVEYKKDSTPQGLDSAIGRISRMNYSNNKSVVEFGIRKAEQEIQSLERWLFIYETDKFGKFSSYGNEININRLLLIPVSTQCIHCAGK
jgi:DnaK suppressor protein